MPFTTNDSEPGLFAWLRKPFSGFAGNTPKWHYIYYLLAAFDILTVSISLYLNHQLVDTYERAARLNQEWRSLQQEILELGNVALAMSAPGNDVFITRDPEQESKKFKTLQEDFGRRTEVIEDTIVTLYAVSPADPVKQHLQSDLRKIKADAEAIDKIVAKVFSNISKSNEYAASKFMAQMDRKFSEVAGLISKFAGDISKIQNALSEEQVSNARHLRQLESLIFGLMIVMVMVATLYGRSIARRVRREEELKNAMQKELLQHKGHLQTLVDEQLRDIKEQKERAERANQSKTIFLANITHELKTPVHCIINFAELGVSDYNNGRTEGLKEHFEDVLSNAWRLDSLISNLLNISKVESGNLQLSLEKDYISALIENAIVATHGISMKKELTVELEKTTLSDAVLVDARWLVQVFTNLTSNAIRFSPQKGRITWRLAETTLPAPRHDTPPIPAISVCIEDEGPGIPEEELEGIFIEFMQGSAGHLYGGGTGLGLAICKRIVNAFGGKISARNSEKHGAIFEVVLPHYSA